MVQILYLQAGNFVQLRPLFPLLFRLQIKYVPMKEFLEILVLIIFNITNFVYTKLKDGSTKNWLIQQVFSAALKDPTDLPD